MYFEMMHYIREHEDELMFEVRMELRSRGVSDELITRGFRDYAMGA